MLNLNIFAYQTISLRFSVRKNVKQAELAFTSPSSLNHFLLSFLGETPVNEKQPSSSSSLFAFG